MGTFLKFLSNLSNISAWVSYLSKGYIFDINSPYFFSNRVILDVGAMGGLLAEF